MIIQCDHCNARFKIDDAKLANGPVKVRCAKCKEVFVVRPEETAADSVAPPQPFPEAPSAEKKGVEEFSFDTPVRDNAPAEQAADDFSFGLEEPPAPDSDASAQPGSASEFDWQATATSETEGAGAESRFDLSAFDASLAAATAAPAVPAAPESKAALSEDNEFDFGEIDFSAQSAPPETSAVATDDAAADDFPMDFGEVSFVGQAAADDASQNSPAAAAAEFAAFPESLSPAAEPEAAKDFLLSFAAESPPTEASVASPTLTAASGNAAEFSSTDKSIAGFPDGITTGGGEPTEADGGFALPGFSEGDPEDDLPPSSLTSRKKSGSSFPLVVIAGAIVLIVALAGGGIYFFGGAKAFSKVGLGFLVEWYGAKGADEGSIALKNVTAAYMTNSTAGELFVVRGEAVNNYSKQRASIQVKVSLLGPGGTNLVTKSAYCGNSLSNEQLTTLPLAKIEEIMANQFGDSLANLGLKPGGTIPFVVVVSPLPKDASDYSVVVGGSTVATQ